MSWERCAKYLLWLLLVAILLFHASKIECCIHEERLALLEIKAYLKSYRDQNPLYADSDTPWSENGQRYNCCAWDMVVCNMSTGRVTKLDLSGMAYFAQDATQKPWLFNVTMFRPFRQLIDLDLSQNSINGLVESDGSTNISTLKNLQFLNLGSTSFQNGSLSVAVLTSLKKLVLAVCAGLSESSFLSQDLQKLRELQVLDLRGNDFHVPVKELVTHLANPEELQVLYLGDNNFHGSFQGFCKLRNLQELHLQNNLLDGYLPSCIKNLSSLQIFDVSNNNFNGEFSLTSLANLSDLQELRLSGNKLDIQMGDSWWQPRFQLQSLYLGGCILNNTYKTISKFLLHQTNLIDLDLSHTNSFEAFPTWLLNSNSKLRTLYLANNSLRGSFELPRAVNLSLLSLDISYNQFHGKLPENIGLVFPNLEYLNLSMNHFEGHIPPSIGHITGLRYMDLSNNNFSGELPSRLLSDCNYLEVLQVSDNNLQGEAITENMNLPWLNWLKLSNNQFGGTIKGALQKSSYLNYLDISNNNVIGKLPGWIGNFSYLYTLSMSGNNLQGRIPTELCKLRLGFLDLSKNAFSGFIPSCSRFSSLNFLHLQQNSLTGPIPNALSSCSSLKTLDLKDNHLSGGIPLWINKLSSLRVLLLAGNTLYGEIPNQICQLDKINILDLSNNSLHGPVPTCLENMSFGRKYVSSSSFYDQTIISPILDDYHIIYTLDDPSVLEQHSLPEEVEFLEKNGYFSYVGGILRLMSGLDLSGNQLTGVIPSELGNLVHIHSLNLSHNLFFGSIPSSFSNLKQVESLDLSFNNLSGMIPSQLVELNFLAIFNVSYNNLTGRVPETGQFANFDESNYFGNQELCGLPVNISCNPKNEVPPPSNKKDVGEMKAGIDMVDFFWSFGVSGVTMFLATNAIFCINPQWRAAWFDFVEWHMLWWLPIP